MSNFRLTQRELDIISELVKGKTNKEIADSLYVSRSTVKSYMEKLFEMFSVCNRVQLALKVINEGIVSVNIH